MSNGKTKVYKNPDRDRPTVVKPYVPQYVIEGIEPKEFKSAVVPAGHPVAKPSSDNPRLPRPPIRQPYAESSPLPFSLGKGPLPNVGNNVEHSWSSVDGDIVDDLSGQEIDPNHPMVDNNDYMSAEAMGLPPSTEDMPQLDETVVQAPKKFVTNEELVKMTQGEIYFEGTSNPPTQGSVIESPDGLLSVVYDLEEDCFLLIVNGEAVCSGPLEYVQEAASALVFGEHELCAGEPIDIEDIVILKRVSIKYGLFLQ